MTDPQQSDIRELVDRLAGGDRSAAFALHAILSEADDVARLLRTYADQEARRYGTTRAQWALLVSLERNEGLKQSELADMLDVQPITLTRLVDRLCANGMIERRPDPAFVVKDQTAHKYTGKPFPWRNPDGVTLVIEADRVKFARLPFVHAPGGR